MTSIEQTLRICPKGHSCYKSSDYPICLEPLRFYGMDRANLPMLEDASRQRSYKFREYYRRKEVT